MQYCPHCIQPSEGDTCAHCGKPIHWRAPENQLQPGTLLRGSGGHMYQIGAAKGQGGFGITYAAMDLATRRRMAIKEYFPSQWGGRNRTGQVAPLWGREQQFARGKRCFLEEAQMLSTVAALPCVVSVRDYFEAFGTAYLVMEYVEGESLYAATRRMGRIQARTMLKLLPELLRDLQTLHQVNIIHRDISPDNLIMTPEGGLKLLDFGSARSTQEDGSRKIATIKAGFSPLEQFDSSGQGSWTDVYALCATIYYCLTGKVPTNAKERSEGKPLPSPNSLGAGLTMEQEQALLRGMHMDPKARIRTMGQLAQELLPKKGSLQEWLLNFLSPSRWQRRDSESPEAQKESHGLSGWRWTASRKRTLAGAAAAAVLLAVVLAIPGTKTEGDYVFRVRNGLAYVTDYRGSASELVTPAQLGGCPVAGIDGAAFRNCDSLVSVSLPDTVTTVEKGAFRGCGNLQCILSPDPQVYHQLEQAQLEAQLCYVGQELPSGLVQEVMVRQGVAYAVTDQSKAVVMGPQEEAALPSQVEDMRVFDASGNRLGADWKVSSDGFRYEVIDDQVILLLYTGAKTDPVVPDAIAGKRVTAISSGCFANNSRLNSVTVGSNVQTLEPGAFDGCGNLRSLTLSGKVKHAEGAVKDCPSLRAVLHPLGAKPQWALPRVQYYVLGMDQGYGKLEGVHVEPDGAVYGRTDKEVALLLDVPEDAAAVQIPEAVEDCAVIWVVPEALEGTENVVIALREFTLFPWEIYEQARWEPGSLGTLSYNWVYSCLVCQEINRSRTSGNEITPIPGIVRANTIRAMELKSLYAFERPDGSDWADLLEEYGVEFDYGTASRDTLFPEQEPFGEEVRGMILELVEDFKGTDEKGRYRTLFGVAVYYDEAINCVYLAASALGAE